jgi:magnesium chelatase family protein
MAELMDKTLELLSPEDREKLASKTRHEIAALRGRLDEILFLDGVDGPTAKQVMKGSELTGDAFRLMERALMQRWSAPRRYPEIMRMAKAVQALDAASKLETKHIAEALQYGSFAELRDLADGVDIYGQALHPDNPIVLRACAVLEAYGVQSC